MIQAMTWALVFTSGAGMSFSGPMSTDELGREAAGQALELAQAELLGVDLDAALAAAVGDAHDRALPGHPHRERLDLVDGHVLVVAEAALGGTAAQVVLDAVAGEHLHVPVVHRHREVDGELAAGLPQDLAQAGIQVEPLGGEIELTLRHRPGVHDGSRVLRGHVRRSSSCGERRAPSPGRAGSRGTRTPTRGYTAPGCDRPCRIARNRARWSRFVTLRIPNRNLACCQTPGRPVSRPGAAPRRRTRPARNGARSTARWSSVTTPAGGHARGARSPPRGTPRCRAPWSGRSPAARPGAPRCSSSRRARARPSVRGLSIVSTTPSAMVMMGFTESTDPMAAWAALMRPPRRGVLERVEHQEQARVRAARLQQPHDRVRRLPGRGGLRGEQRQQALAQGRGLESTTWIGAPGIASRAMSAALYVADSRLPTVRHTTAVGARIQTPLERRHEVARRTGGRRRDAASRAPAGARRTRAPTSPRPPSAPGRRSARAGARP